MRREFFAAAFLGAAALIAMSVPAHAQKFSGKFSGFNELGGLNAETGAILSEGKEPSNWMSIRAVRPLPTR